MKSTTTHIYSPHNKLTAAQNTMSCVQYIVDLDIVLNRKTTHTRVDFASGALVSTRHSPNHAASPSFIFVYARAQNHYIYMYAYTETLRHG